MSVAAAASLKRGGSSSSHGNDNVPVLWRPFPSDPNMKLASNTRAGLQRRKAGNKVAPAEAGAGTSPVHGSSKTAATTRGSAHVGRRRQRAKSRSRAGRLSGGARVPQYRENTLRERAVGLVTFWMASVAISFAICAPVLFGLDSHDAYEYTACANVTITCGTMLLGAFYCTNFSGRWGYVGAACGPAACQLSSFRHPLRLDVTRGPCVLHPRWLSRAGSSSRLASCSCS